MKLTVKDMPSSPKSFYPRQSWLSYTRRTSISICFLLIGILGFTFGLVSILRPISGYKCRNSEPKSVSVVWDSGSSVSDSNRMGLNGNQKRHKVMGFVGIQTGFESVGRRRSLRKTWMPSDRQGLQRLAFFKAAYGLFDSDFYVKADDDIYLRPDRLSLLLAKERSDPRTYLGCLKKGPVFSDPNLKWYEPLSYMLGKEYFLHAYGPIYALSAQVVSSLVTLRNDSFRMFSNEDVTIGAWMLAMNVNHEDNRALCEPECTPTSVAVWDIPTCSGLCNPEKKLLELHQKESCANSPTLESDE